ncbi:MAG: hypothetical protein MHPSP_000649 [Paramarteilia canceri]
MSQEKSSSSIHPLATFTIAGVSAAISKTAAAPIERVKLLLQNQDEMLKSGRLQRRYTGLGDCFSSTYKAEGFKPFFRGNLPNVLRYFPTQSLNFLFKDMAKFVIPEPVDKSDFKMFASNIIRGGMSGSLSLSIVYTLDFARTRLANDLKHAKTGDKRQYNGLIDVYRQTYKTDGLRGLHRGFFISCVGVFMYRGFYFGLYDSFKETNISKSPFMRNPLVDFAAGYTITVVSGLLSYPFDTIRRRMMMTTGEKIGYKGSIDCTLQILKKEGAKSFYKGAGANILRGVAGGGVLFLNDKFTALYKSL